MCVGMNGNGVAAGFESRRAPALARNTAYCRHRQICVKPFLLFFNNNREFPLRAGGPPDPARVMGRGTASSAGRARVSYGVAADHWCRPRGLVRRASSRACNSFEQPPYVDSFVFMRVAFSDRRFEYRLSEAKCAPRLFPTDPSPVRPVSNQEVVLHGTCAFDAAVFRTYYPMSTCGWNT